MSKCDFFHDRTFFFLCALLVAVCFCETGHSFGSLVGREAPPFKVRSGDGLNIDLGAVRGKVVVIFYETRDVVEKNRMLKKELNAFYDGQSEKVKASIVRLPIVDCSRAVWPLTGVWERNLARKSKDEGLTIYGDWDGRMSEAYGMKADDSNVVIVDRKGIVRLLRSGEVTLEKFGEITLLLHALVREGDGF
jgi:predicted transcriptional regulator